MTFSYLFRNDIYLDKQENPISNSIPYKYSWWIKKKLKKSKYNTDVWLILNRLFFDCLCNQKPENYHSTLYLICI